MRQPINNPSRVPAYFHGRKSAVSAISCVTSAQYRGRLGGGGCFFASFFTLKKVRSSFIVSQKQKNSFERETKIEPLL